MKSNLSIALVAAVCMVQSAAARAQESWGSSGGASSWQAGAVKATVHTAPSVATGGSSSWTAGQGSTGTRSQRGGVWNDGSALGAGASKMPALGSAARASSLNRPAGLPAIGPAPSRLGVAGGRAQSTGFSGSLRSSTGARLPGGGPHPVGSGIGGAHRASTNRPAAGGHGKRPALQGGNRRLNLGSGLASPLPSSALFKSLPGALPGENPGSELRSPLGGPQH